MKKCLIALLLVVALVVTVSVFAVSAAEPTQLRSDLTVAGDGATATGYCPHCNQSVTWTKFAPTANTWTAMPAGHNFLGANYSTTSSLEISKNGDTVLHLNGHTITGSGSSTSGVLAYYHGNFHLVDSTAETGAVQATGGRLLFMQHGTSKTAQNVKIYSGDLTSTGAVGSRTYGGIIRNATYSNSAWSGRPLNIELYDTTLSGGIAKNAGGAICVYGGTVTMYKDAVIENCSSSERGGAVYVFGTGKFVLDGGTIQNNNSVLMGGAIYAKDTATVEIKSGTIQNCKTTGSNAAGVGLEGGTFIMSSGTIDNCDGPYTGQGLYIGAATATITGGTIRGCDATGGPAGGMVAAANAQVTASGLTVENCSATGEGGGVYVRGDATSASFENCTFKNSTSDTMGGNLSVEKEITVSGCTFEGGSSPMGGSLYVEVGNLVLSDCSFDGGSAENGHGGNIYWDSARKLTVSGTTTITNGTALRSATDGKNGLGGNIYVAKGSFEMTGGEISNGTTGENAQHGGNLYLKGTSTISGGTVTGGNVLSYGGNIYVDGTTLAVTGTAAITNGDGGYGGNIYINAGTVNISGTDVEISGNKAVEYICNKGTVNVSNATIQKSGHATAIRVMENGKVNLSGEANVDAIWVQEQDVDTAASGAQVTIKAGYTGEVYVGWRSANIGAAVQPGADIDLSLCQDSDYVGTGTVKALVSLNDTSKYFDVVDTGEAFKVAAAAAVTFGGIKADGTEVSLEDLDTAGDYVYIKLYKDGEVRLTGNTTFDLNGKNADFITGDYKLTVIDQNTDDLSVSGSTFTVDNTDNLMRDGVNPVNNYHYVVVEETETPGVFTSNYVKVSIHTVSIKPLYASLYYTTDIATNDKVAPYAKTYGVVLSLADMPEADFVNDVNVVNGEEVCENLYTEFDLEKNAGFTVPNFRSCLLEGILREGDEPEYLLSQNGAEVSSGVAEIYANAFVKIELPGEENTPRYIMAEKTYDYSLKEIVTIIDGRDDLVSNPNVTDMYDKWHNPMSGWDLFNINRAWEERAGAAKA